MRNIGDEADLGKIGILLLSILTVNVQTEIPNRQLDPGIQQGLS